MIVMIIIIVCYVPAREGLGCLLANVCAYIANKEIDNVMILFDS